MRVCVCFCVLVFLCVCVFFFVCFFFACVFFVCVWVGGSIQKYVGRRCTAFSVRRLARLFLCTLDDCSQFCCPKVCFGKSGGLE